MGIFNENLNKYIYVHPTFLYESIGTFLIFILLIYKQKNKKFSGQVFYIYMILYGIVRMIVEGFRTDSLMLGNLRISQILSIVFVVLFVFLYYFNEKRKTK